MTTTLPPTTTTSTTTKSADTSAVVEATTVDPASMSGSKTGDNCIPSSLTYPNDLFIVDEEDSSSNEGGNCKMLEGGGLVCEEVEDEFPRLDT